MYRTMIILAAIAFTTAWTTNADPIDLSRVLTATFTNVLTEGVSDEIETLRGQIDEIVIDVVTPGATGDVSVVITSQNPLTMDPITLVSSNSFAADFRFRPRVPTHDLNGVELTGDTQDLYSIVGATLKFAVTNANKADIVFKCTVKLRK